MANKKNVTATDVIDFWFNEIKPEQWWNKSAAFDKEIKNRFHDIYKKAAIGELVNWRYKPLSSLAEILCQFAVDKGFDNDLNPEQKAFMYMPMMHSESAEIHKAAEFLFSAPGMENNYQFELKHKAIIDRFGRYPHRNKILGRRMRKAEIDFLKEPNSSF